MEFSVINWNILYEMKRPGDKARFDATGKPTEFEKKAVTSALAFFCYDDNVCPSILEDEVEPINRQLVKQIIKKKEFPYYRGGSNAHVRMPEVVDSIGELASLADAVCLEEVTPEMAWVLKNEFAATHHVGYSYKDGNNHGVAVLVDKLKFALISEHEVDIKSSSGIQRKVKVMDVQDLKTKGIVRVAAAHLFGRFGETAPVDKEAGDLFEKVKALSGKYDVIAICADANETKANRDSVFPKQVQYADVTNQAGWNLHLVGRAPQAGPIPVIAKPFPFGVCTIMLDKAHPSVPIDLSSLPAGLSDHAPIGTRITVTPTPLAPSPAADPKAAPAAKAAVAAPSPKAAAAEPAVEPAAEPVAPPAAPAAGPAKVAVPPAVAPAADPAKEPTGLAWVAATIGAIWAKFVDILVAFWQTLFPKKP